MELSMLSARAKKAQLMTVIMVVVFLLMLSALFVFALLNINSNTLVQSITSSSASNNYANLLKLSANNFASAALSKALSTLAAYEINPGTRKVNFISNTSLYLTYLIVNGTLPNDTSGYPQNTMGNLTFVGYNKSIAAIFGFEVQTTNINESRPRISQTDPYHIRIAYTERVLVNATNNVYRYNIPVNVTLALNGTPDLFYAQRGVFRPIRFANLSNITSIVANTYAAAGNTQIYAYGSVLNVPSNSISGASCPTSPPLVSTPPVSNSIIITTYNGQSLGSCINTFGGLITYNAPTTLPTVPYLIYPSSTNFLKYLPNGTAVLLYGPGLDTLNIEGLRSAVMNSYYFASPFAPSYLDRGGAGLTRQSPNGIFLFSNYNLQTASFPGASGTKITMNNPPARVAPTAAISVSAWIYSRGGSGTSNSIVSTSSCGYGLADRPVPYGYAFSVCNSGTPYYSPNVILSTGSWHMLLGVFNGTNTKLSMYLDGNFIGTNTAPAAITYPVNPPTNLVIAEQAGNGQPFNGLIANVQIYNKSLTAQQVQTLYIEGIEGLPLNNNALIGWWPLNGDGHDYSGYNLNGTVVGANFVPPNNYTRDSIFATPIPSKLSPLPGIVCNNNSQCTNNSRGQLYLGYLPLEMQINLPQVAQFNGISAYNNNPSIKTTKTLGLSWNSFSLTAWFNFGTQCSSYAIGNGDEVVLSQNTLGGATVPWIELFCAKSTNKWQFNVGNDAGTVYNAIGNTLLPNTWYMGAITYAYSTNTMKLYLNTSLQASNTIAGIIGSNALLYIGNGENSFPGNIANVQYYNATLTAGQVQQLYQEGVGGLPLQANIVSWWPLNGDSNDYAAGNNGIATNVVYPYLTGNYNAPGLSAISVALNEWQALGLANT